MPAPSIKSFCLRNGDCREVLPRFPSGSAACVITDPPYGLSFMGKGWDHGVPGVPFWEAALGIVRPGGYLLAFGGTRTYHRLTCAIEDAGWEIRDCLLWLYGTGFPKGQACLKPAWEPIVLARKPDRKSAPLNIDACRIGTDVVGWGGGGAKNGRTAFNSAHDGSLQADGEPRPVEGRWPANVAHDGSDEVLEAFAAFGAVSRFFYCAKASRRERDEGLDGMEEKRCGMMEDDNYPIKTGSGNVRDTKGRNDHPTVKPLALMRWLVRLVSLEGELVVDPFMGSGTTGKACAEEGRRFLGIDNDTEHGYFEIATRRVQGGYDAFQPSPEDREPVGSPQLQPK